MKLTIQEIRTAYRNAIDKDAAIKELAASEEVSEQMIKFYVRGNTGPVRPTETPSQYIAEAFAPVPKKRRGRPAEMHDADKKVIKTPKIVNEEPEIVNVELDPVVDEVKPKDTTVQYTHFEPVTQVEREMFFADIADDEPVELQKPQMTLLGQEVKNFDDVTRVMMEAKATKEKKAPQATPGKEIEVHIHGGDWTEAMNRAIMPEDVEAQSTKPLTYILKCQQPYFDDIWEGYTPFEIRHNDREYKSGDSVVLKDYNASDDTYGDRQIRADIGFLLSGEKFPFLNKQYSVFTLLDIKRYELREVTVHD